jgi:hypothetical protein
MVAALSVMGIVEQHHADKPQSFGDGAGDDRDTHGAGR